MVSDEFCIMNLTHYKKITDVISYIVNNILENQNIFVKFYFNKCHNDPQKILLREIEVKNIEEIPLDITKFAEKSLENLNVNDINFFEYSYDKWQKYFHQLELDYADKIFINSILRIFFFVIFLDDNNNMLLENHILLMLNWTLLLHTVYRENFIDENDLNFKFSLISNDLFIGSRINSININKINNKIIKKNIFHDSLNPTNKNIINFETFVGVTNNEEKNFSFFNDRSIIDRDSRSEKQKINFTAEMLDRNGNRKRKRKDNICNKNNLNFTLTNEQTIILEEIFKKQQPFHIVVDGIAGTGKTTFIYHLLRKNFKIIYLVKKKSDVQNMENKFKVFSNNNLFLYTIDAFLMRQLNFRSLPKWLKVLNSLSYNSLLKISQNKPIDQDLSSVYFIDEYSLVEFTLITLLNNFLTLNNQIMVGDCEQQSPIGSAEDQPLQTMLSLQTTFFMHESVRTKDWNLIQRLEKFRTNVEGNMLNALIGLPIVDQIEISVKRKIPKFIVCQNVKMNYINWAVCKLIAEKTNRKYLCYTRTFTREITSRKKSQMTDDIAEIPDKFDDPYADEHYIIVDQPYRMIKTVDTLQKGSRVVVKSIVSKNVIVVRDEYGGEHTLSKTKVQPYSYGSSWTDTGYCLVMFPLICDIATTVYQIQGVTLKEGDYPECYIDAYGMNKRSVYVALSRFESERQIKGIINSEFTIAYSS